MQTTCVHTTCAQTTCAQTTCAHTRALITCTRTHTTNMHACTPVGCAGWLPTDYRLAAFVTAMPPWHTWRNYQLALTNHRRPLALSLSLSICCFLLFLWHPSPPLWQVYGALKWLGMPGICADDAVDFLEAGDANHDGLLDYKEWIDLLEDPAKVRQGWGTGGGGGEVAMGGDRERTQV